MNQTMSIEDREGFAAFLLRLRGKGMVSKALIAAFEATPRHGFLSGQYHALAWSDRMLPIECGEAIEGADLQAAVIAALGIEAGNRVLEIRPHGVHKGRIIPPMSPEREARTTILAIGDDRTDEDLFASLPPDAISVRVGPGATRARFRLEGTASVRALLQMLAETGVREHLANG